MPSSAPDSPGEVHSPIGRPPLPENGEQSGLSSPDTQTSLDRGSTVIVEQSRAVSSTVLNCYIPAIPPSCNDYYNYLWHLRRRPLKQEVVMYKSLVKFSLPQAAIPTNTYLKLSILVKKSWLTKEGKPRVQDVHNMIKAIQDAIAERYGFNDCWIWNTESIKRHTSNELETGTYITLSTYEEV